MVWVSTAREAGLRPPDSGYPLGRDSGSGSVGDADSDRATMALTGRPF
jgi:hypothetical protein